MPQKHTSPTGIAHAERTDAGVRHLMPRVGALDLTHHLEPVAELAAALTKGA